ncbi:MAG: AAA family ATPase, partial [Caldithrix sp.]|nr:AAA family ATPase [Caldithrix sp.]
MQKEYIPDTVNYPTNDLYQPIESLSKLKGIFKKTTNGKGGVVIIEGETGIGKSTLLHHFKNEIQPGNTEIHTTDFKTDTHTHPYSPFLFLTNESATETEVATAKKKKKFNTDGPVTESKGLFNWQALE